MDYNEFYQEMNDHYYRAYCYHGVKDPSEDATSGNHHVINGIYHLITEKLVGHQGTPSDNYIREAKFLKETEVDIGVYNRHPEKAADLESHDDYIGILVSSYMMNMMDKYNILSHGKRNHWYYDNLKTNFKFTNWFGRFPFFPGIVKRANNVELNWYNRLGYIGWLLSTVYFHKDRNDTTGIILQWLSISIMKDESKLVNWAIGKWEAKIKQDYPGQMGEVLGIYYGVDHPFAKVMNAKI